MTAIEHLNSYGVTPRLKPDGSLSLSGMKRLPENTRAEVITWAKDNREAILKELNPNEKNVFTQKGGQAPAPLKIEPMTTCLHGKKCPHLDGPGGRRPICSKAGTPVFDLNRCPLNRWT